MSNEQFNLLGDSDYEEIAGEIRSERRELPEPKAKRRWPSISIREHATRMFKAFAIGLVASTILLVLALALWYKYVYPENAVGKPITPDRIGYSVRYPEWIGIGDTEQFRISLTNEGTHSLSNVRVYLDFSDAAIVAAAPGHSLTAEFGTLSVNELKTRTIELYLAKVDGNNVVQTDLLFASDESGEKLLGTYTFKVVGVPYMENLRGPKNLIRWFLGGSSTLVGTFLVALVASVARKRRKVYTEGTWAVAFWISFVLSGLTLALYLLASYAPLLWISTFFAIVWFVLLVIPRSSA